MPLVFFVTGEGLNFKAIFSACNEGKLNRTVALVISNREQSNALYWYKDNYILNSYSNSSTLGSAHTIDSVYLQKLTEYKADWLILAGYTWKICSLVLNYFNNKVLNIQPSLLPEFGGKDMYDLNVHKASIVAKESEFSSTIHLVNND